MRFRASAKASPIPLVAMRKTKAMIRVLISAFIDAPPLKILVKLSRPMNLKLPTPL